jgi:hypothetical protein
MVEAKAMGDSAIVTGRDYKVTQRQSLNFIESAVVVVFPAVRSPPQSKMGVLCVYDELLSETQTVY